MEALETNLSSLPEREKGEKTSSYLKRLESFGFLFHGTNAETEELEPRKANDPNSQWNSQEALRYLNGRRYLQWWEMCGHGELK